MIFEVGDIIGQPPSGSTYLVIDVTEEDMTLQTWPRKRFAGGTTAVIPKEAWSAWTILQGREITSRPRKTHRNLDLG